MPTTKRIHVTVNNEQERYFTKIQNKYGLDRSKTFRKILEDHRKQING